MKILPITEVNYPQLAQIYLAGIQTGVATFETAVPDWESWDSTHVEFGRICLFDGPLMLGWAALSPVSSRCVYGGVAEVSVYVSPQSRGKGIGNKLLNELINISEQNGIWTLQSGIMRENTASIHLHKKCGFREIGYREKVAKLDGVWKDNVLMERRSTKIGL